MHHVLGVSGSLRSGSANTGLLRMAARLAPAKLAIAEFDGLGDLPYYNADLDTPEAWPPAVRRWREAVETADALLLAAPEYNWGPTAVMKNALDWVSRPPGQHLIQGKIVAVISAGGGGGGRKVQAYLNEVLGLLGNTMVTEPEIAIRKGADVVGADGTTTDPEIETLMGARLDALTTALQSR